MPVFVDENEIQWRDFPDRRATDLISAINTDAHAGLSLGVAEYTATEYGALQRHDDQECVYCVSGQGFIRIGEQEYGIHPGCAFYIGRGVIHATKRNGPAPVKVIYVHAPD